MTNDQIRLASWRLFVVMLATGVVYGATFLFTDAAPESANDAARVWHLFAALACVTYPVFAVMCDLRHLSKLHWGLIALLVTPGYNLLTFVVSSGLSHARGVTLPSGGHDAVSGVINLVGVVLLFWCALPQCFEGPREPTIGRAVGDILKDTWTGKR